MCLPHAAALLSRAQKHLGGSARREFAASLLSLVKSNLAQDEKDLDVYKRQGHVRVGIVNGVVFHGLEILPSLAGDDLIHGQLALAIICLLYTSLLP